MGGTDNTVSAAAGLPPLGVQSFLDEPQHRISFKLKDLRKQPAYQPQTRGFVHKGTKGVAPTEQKSLTDKRLTMRPQQGPWSFLGLSDTNGDTKMAVKGEISGAAVASLLQGH